MSEVGQFRGLERFDKVDATSEQGMFFAFLDQVEVLPDVVRRRQRSYDLLRLKPGQHAVDVGCGLGTVVREIAVALPRGRAMGIDLSAAMIAEARRRAAANGVTATFEESSVETLPLARGSVHAYRAERLYQHVPNVPLALSEARRVLAPGGRIVLIDQDWDLAVLDADDLVIAGKSIAPFATRWCRAPLGAAFVDCCSTQGLWRSRFRRRR